MADTHSRTGGLARLLPGVRVLATYQRHWLRGDLLAGLTVAAYLVPQVMAYGSLAGLTPAAGLWAAVPAMLVYAFLGSSKQLSVGPESTTAVMTAVAIAPLAAGDPARYAVLAATLAVVVGLLCLIAWAARLGVIADLLSKPILVGYMTGVALIMIVSQFGKLTGVPVKGETFLGQLNSFIRHISEIHLATVIFAAAVLTFLFVVQWRFPDLPGPLLAVLLATATMAAFDLQQYGLKAVGPVPAGLPRPELPSLGDLRLVLLPAVGVMLVGFTDNVLTARSFAIRTGDSVDATQELLALGIANLGAGVSKGFPVSSSGSRTAVGASTGSRTQVYSLTALVLVIAVLLFLGPVLARFPQAALGAIVVYAAVQLIDIPGFRRLGAFRRSELMLALGTLAGVLILDILYGILLAVGLSIAELLARSARPHDAVQGLVPGLAGMHDVDDYPTAQTIPGLVVYRYDSPLFFANAENFRLRALGAVDAQRDPVAWFVLNTEANVEVDITALDAVEELRKELTRRGIVFALARVKQDLLDDLDAYGLTAAVGPEYIFPTMPTAVGAYREWAQRQSPPWPVE